MNTLTLGEICNLSYHYVTAGKSKAQVREIDLALLGPEGESPQETARANQEAMAALQIGAVGRRKGKS